RVMAPKVAGTWNLHRLTLGLPLDFFLLFSSAASMVGSPGQGNHAAANAFLDGLAHYRRSRGLPAVAINWGGWTEVGAAARKEAGAHQPVGSGISSLAGIWLLERIVQEDRRLVGVLPVDWAE